MCKILLAGGAGYIGSHTAVELIESGHEVIILDNYSNSSPVTIERIGNITGKIPIVYEADACDYENIDDIFKENDIDCVIHFAGFKAVGESVDKPLEYYRNNLDSTLTLLECMRQNNVNKFVFSSSATVYGGEHNPPYVENMPRGVCSNPYGWTKSMIEQILEDVSAANPDLSVAILRYFNPIGAHSSGMIGEDPRDIPNNLMPFVSQVAVGRRDKLTVFGGDYDTPDGTCRRDYIHVVDLAKGHVRAVEYLADKKGVEIFNLGTGTPYSVLDIVNSFVSVNGIDVPYEIGGRRAGDLPEVWADAEKAERLLGWKAELGIDDMCRDTWNWQKNNPMGYEG